MIPTTAQRRRAVRVLLLDPADQVLLLRGCDPAVPGVSWWITPGGGLEAGEDSAAAARREMAEETGLTEIDIGPVVAYGTASFSYRGQAFEQDQCYRLARIARGAASVPPVVPAVDGPDEHARLSEARWWSLAQLRAATETVYPTGLAGLLERLITAGPPVPPVRL